MARFAETLKELRAAEREAWLMYVHAVNHENDDIRQLAEAAWEHRFADLQAALNG